MCLSLLRKRPSAEDDQPCYLSLDWVREKGVGEGLIPFLSVLLACLGPGMGGGRCEYVPDLVALIGHKARLVAECVSPGVKPFLILDSFQWLGYSTYVFYPPVLMGSHLQTEPVVTHT